MSTHQPHGGIKPDRRLGVVMFLDMVGYSARMSKSEKHALERVKDLSALLHRIVPAHGGTLVKFLGDGTMAEFPTALAAVTASDEILAAIREHNGRAEQPDQYAVRIGLHLGDLMEKDKDLFGDTVNVSARIQPLADSNGLAMSQAVHLSVRNQLPLRGAYLGTPKLKNIPEKIPVFFVPPPDTPLFQWYLKRRNPINTRFRALLLGVGMILTGLTVWWINRPDAPRAALLYVSADPLNQGGRPSPDIQGATERLTEELNLRGARIRGLAWTDRGAVLALARSEGVEQPTDTNALDLVAGRIGKRGKLTYLLSGRLKDIGSGREFQFRGKLVESNTLAVSNSFTIEGRTPDEIADRVVAQLTAWARAKDAPAPARPAAKPARRR